MTAQIGTAILLEYRTPRPQQVGDAIELDYSGGATAIGQGGMRLGGSAAIQTLIRTLFEYQASGGLRGGGSADVEKRVRVSYAFAPTGGIHLSSAARAALEFAALPPDATDRVSVTAQGEALKITQATLRKTDQDHVVDLTAIGQHAHRLGQTLTLRIDRTRPDGSIQQSYTSLSAPITYASQHGQTTQITASISAGPSPGSFSPQTVFARSSSMIRTPIDHRVTPGCRYQGAVIRSVTTTLGVNSPWFTEVNF
jgi:hypothetical protein